MVNVKLCASAPWEVLSRDNLKGNKIKYWWWPKEYQDLYIELQSREFRLIKADPSRGAWGVVHLRLSQESVKKRLWTEKKSWPTLVWGDSHSPRCRRTWRGWAGSAGRPSGSSEQRSGNQPSMARPPENTNPDGGCPWLAYLQVGWVLPLGSWIDPADLFAVVIHKLRPFVTILQDLLGLWLSKGRHVVVPDANIRRKLSCTQSNLLGSFIVKSMEVNCVNVIHKIWQFLWHLLKCNFSWFYSYNFKTCYLFLGFLLAIISFVIVVIILLLFCTLILRQALCLDEDLPPQSHWRRQVSGLLVRLGGVEEVAEDAGQVVGHPVLLLQTTVVLYWEDHREVWPGTELNNEQCFTMRHFSRQQRVESNFICKIF